MTRVLRPSSKSLPKEVTALAKSKNAEVTTNADGSVTKRRDTAKTSKEVTTRTGNLLESSTEFKKSTRTTRGSGESEFTANTDMLGRESSKSRKDFTSNAGVHTVNIAGSDVYGIDKQEKSTDKTVVKGDTTETSLRSSSKDSAGNARKASDVTRVTVGEDGKKTVTTNEKKSGGSELNTRSGTTWEDKKFTLSGGADWSKGGSIDKSTLTETEVDAAKFLEKSDVVTEWVGKIFKGLGLEQQWKSELDASLMKEKMLLQGEHGSVVARYGVSGGQQLTIDGEGIRGSFNRDARAGVYAESHGSVDGKYGTASYDARAAAEAYATVDARGSIDANGLDATVDARVGVSVEAEISGRAQTKSVQIGGVDVNASVEGHARASAEAVAEVNGTVKVTRDPPTAIVRGTAGASAVAKIEGDIHASAGPFSVVASGYVSAGAEARASGVFGYEDGKLKIGGSLGAAFGVGAGGDVQLEIDVAQIGEMAKGAADLNHDGKLGLDDAMVAVEKTAGWIGGLFGLGKHDDKPAAKAPGKAEAVAPATAAPVTPPEWPPTPAGADIADQAINAIGAMHEPALPGPDATPQQLAQYEKDTKRYDRMIELMSTIIKKRDELQMSIIRKT